MKKNDIRTLTRLALLVAIELVMKAVGLGSVPVGPLYMSFLTLPIAVGAITMGPVAGAVLGGVFGAVSFYDAITGASAMTGALFQVSPVNILIAIPFAVISAKINPAGGNNAGIEPNIAFFGLSFLMYGGFNLIFFPVFYKTGRSEGKAFLWGGVFTFLYIIAAESLAQYIPSPVSAYLDTLEKSAQLRQLPVLFAGIILWAVFTLLSAKISAERFEKVDL